VAWGEDGYRGWVGTGQCRGRLVTQVGRGVMGGGESRRGGMTGASGRRAGAGAGRERWQRAGVRKGLRQGHAGGAGGLAE
ncbi:hypothetical protein, partial [Salmonella enterica]|uniref:hypothetical protein n=1 Tax=Salmonella enterica TaxID=28901 RepID=UPI00398C38BA